MADIPIPALPEPKANQPYMKVSALEAGMITLPLHFFVKDATPDEVNVCPSLAFFLQHSSSGVHLVYDLGIRRDAASYPPLVRTFIDKWMPIEVPQSVEESLSKAGVDPNTIETVVLSHLHWDHIGEPSAFPNANFVVGPGSRELMEAGYPENPASDILSSTIPSERSRFLAADDFNVSIGPFPRALDYFGDGSLYLIDAIGHLAGHINILARTSSDGSWIYLAGDTAHDVRLLTGEREVAFGFDPSGKMLCAHAHKDDAVEHIRRVGALLKMPKVHVLLAHDLDWYGANKGGPAFLPGVIPPK
ncbi:Metallo-hydrolase/oxidoreductase [Trametes coccinea BRFM310]|uniref:Metallo-hydrolase/oxidoreductase n=1 Tax=Trametes coccinea (strain BRFM310) TaxID=1353009 RepID=A0A1Y2IMH4_TRAC3|nr:Metallo-hydrolase/oxidoreductase [Trametes coccinea BRFM310]